MSLLVVRVVTLTAAVWPLSAVATLRKIILLVFLWLQVWVSLIGLFVLCRSIKPMFPIMWLLPMLK